MTILIVNSSYRKNGNTSRLLDLLADKINQYLSKTKAEYSLRKLNLRDYKINPCFGCRICFDKGEEKCPQKDDLLKLRDEFLKSHTLIIGSPVYVEDINGALKTLIDRMAFISHRPSLFAKQAYAITTSGVGATSHAISTLQRALFTWGYRLLGQKTFITGDFMSNEEIEIQHGKVLKKIASKIDHACKNDLINKPSLMQLLTFKIQQSYILKQEGTLDYNYWKEKAWLEKKRTYYTGALTGLKIKLAGLFAQIIKSLFLK